MRRSGAEKMEMIRLVEQSDLPVRSTLRQLGIAPSTFYGWYQSYLDGGPEALEDRRPPPRARWNKISQEIRQEVVDLALERTELSARELACRFTDERRYFLSESSVYRILKAYDLITSPAYVLLSASDRFSQPSRRVHELWQTDFTYLRVIGWGWYYLSTVMDDFSRYLIAWRLSPTMAADDVMETLDEALEQTGVESVKGEAPATSAQRQRAGLRLEGSTGVSRRARHDAHPREAVSPADPGQDRALPPLDEERGQARALPLPVAARAGHPRFRRLLQPRALPRVARERHADGRLRRAIPRGPVRKDQDQTADDAAQKEGVPAGESRLAPNHELSLRNRPRVSEIF